MAAKPTYRELELRIKALELELGGCKQTITMAFESANLLQKAIDRAPVMAWTVDQKGMLSSMAGAGLIGLESRLDQVLGQPISDVFMDYPKIMADTQQAMAEKEFFSTMDHKGCILECHYAPLRDRSGKAVGAIGVARDVTKQVQNEAHYRGLFENAPTSLWEEDLSAVKTYITKLGRTGVTDFKTYFDRHPEALIECAALIKIVDINQTTLDMYGAKHKEELVSGLEQVFTGSAYEDLKIQLVAIADGKTSFESEIVNQTLTGAKMHLVLRWFVSPGHEASYSKVFLALTDITDRVIAEKALESSGRDWENIFQAIGHPTIILDPQHRVIVANRVTVEKTGISPRELMHKRCYEVFHGHQPCCENLLGYRSNEIYNLNFQDITPAKWHPIETKIIKKQVLARGYSDPYEKEYKRKDGSVLPVELRTYLVRNKTGNPAGMWAFIRDISNWKRWEAALQESESKFRSFFDLSPQAAARVHFKTGQVADVNQKNCASSLKSPWKRSSHTP